MVKQKGVFSFKDIGGLTNGIIKKMPIQHETLKSSQSRGTIGTGIYVLNAAISSDIYGGIPDNRITVFGAPSGTGKSFLCYSIAKQAQAKGLGVIYIDTEYAIELDQLPGYGIDIDEEKFMLIRTNVIEDVKVMLTQLLDGLKDQKEAGNDIQKFIIFIDSVGQLGSRKEVEDALVGKEKADFTKAKALASLFRIINSDLGYLSIPLVCTNHTYQTMDLYPQDKMKGGEGLFYAASAIAFLSKAKLKTGEIDDLDLGQSGLVVTAKMVKNRMAKPKKVKFEISFTSGCNPYVGLDYWCNGENFEQVGVAKGKMVGETFVPGGNRWYIRHIGKHIAGAELFSEKVFTKEVLDALRPIIKEYFRYKSITEINEIEKKLMDAKGEYDDDDEIYADDLDSNSLFDTDND
jgi:RecA/RadA recombinase